MSNQKLFFYKVSALDFFSFGGLQNFSAGETTFRQGKFPPDISRFFYLVDLSKAAILAVLLLKEDTIYFPVPADWVVPRKGEKGEIEVNKVPYKTYIDEISNNGLKNFLPEKEEIIFDSQDIGLENLPYLELKSEKESSEEKQDCIPKKEGTRGWVSFEDIKPYLEKGTLKDSNGSDKIKPRLSTPEMKVGLTLEKGKFTAEESRLYFEFIERLLFPEDTFPPKEISLLLLILNKDSNGNVPIEGRYYYIGGETRVGKIEPFAGNENIRNLFENNAIEITNGKLYKLYLLSPTFIKDGIKIGSELTLTDLKGNSATFKVKWVFTAGREWLSGFNKPAVEVLNPGTVLVLEAIKEPPDKNLTHAVFIEQYVPKVIKEWFKEQPKKLNFEKFHQYGYNFGLLIHIDK